MDQMIFPPDDGRIASRFMPAPQRLRPATEPLFSGRGGEYRNRSDRIWNYGLRDHEVPVPDVKWRVLLHVGLVIEMRHQPDLADEILRILRDRRSEVVVDHQSLPIAFFPLDSSPDADMAQHRIVFLFRALPGSEPQADLYGDPSIVDQAKATIGGVVPGPPAAVIENSRAIEDAVRLRVGLTTPANTRQSLAEALRTRAPVECAERVVGVVIDGSLDARACIRA